MFHSLNRYTDFHHIFSVCLPRKDLELIKFLGVSGTILPYGNTFNILGSYGVMDVPQPKPMHGFLPNFQVMFTLRGSRAS